MNLGLDGKVVLITGAASGIGRSIALGFGRESSKVVVADVNRVGGKETVIAIKEAGGEADFVQTDVSKEDDVKGMVKFAVDRYGRLDFAVNNAAGRSLNGRPLHDYDEAEWEALISVTLKGVWLSMKYEVIQMLDQGSGAIVNMSSAAGIQGQPGAAMYSAAKHGVLGLTKTAAFDYGEKGIRVNAICPGLIMTPATEPIMANLELRSKFEAVHAFGRLGRPEEVAAAAMWLCSEAASFVTGHAMFVDGGCLAANRLSSTFR